MRTSSASFGLHQLEQGLPALLGELAIRSAASSGCIWSSTSAARSSSSWFRMLDLLRLRHLLEHVGEALVAQFRDLEHPLLRKVEERVGEVGGEQVFVGRQQLGGRLGLTARGVLDGCPHGRTACGPSRRARRWSWAGAGTARTPATRPVRSARWRHPRWWPSPEPSTRVTLRPSISAITPHLAAALLEAAHVDEAGRDDLAGADARDPSDRQEHVPTARHLDDEADDAG
jgi:hypothetical protein